MKYRYLRETISFIQVAPTAAAVINVWVVTKGIGSRTHVHLKKNYTR